MKKFYDVDAGFGGHTYSPEADLKNITNPSIGELYQNVLNKYVYGSICDNIECHTPSNKVDALLKHFQKQRPTIFSKFWWHRSYNAFNEYWWFAWKGGNIQRKLFLAHLAKKYKNKYFK